MHIQNLRATVSRQVTKEEEYQVTLQWLTHRLKVSSLWIHIRAYYYMQKVLLSQKNLHSYTLTP